MVCCSAVLVGLNSRTRTEDPEHEADLYVSEQNIGRTKRVFQRVVDVLVQSAHRLPEDIRAEPNIANCRKLLKTHYFNFVFNVQ